MTSPLGDVEVEVAMAQPQRLLLPTFDEPLPAVFANGLQQPEPDRAVPVSLTTMD